MAKTRKNFYVDLSDWDCAMGYARSKNVSLAELLRQYISRVAKRDGGEQQAVAVNAPPVDVQATDVGHASVKDKASSLHVSGHAEGCPCFLCKSSRNKARHKRRAGK